MPESVIVDDGGSTRIRWKNTGVGHMPELKANGRKTVSTSCKQVGIVYVDEDGIPHHYIVLAPFGKVEIISQGDQNVQDNQNVLVEKIDANSTEISIYGTKTPVVDEKNGPDGKYRYIVSNSGAIKTILVNDVEVYNIPQSGGNQTNPRNIKTPVLYTCVVISE